MIVKYRFWFETPKGYVFGPGSYQILREIEKTGSLRKAAQNLGMSYRHAWGLIKEIEDNLGVKIIASHRGGKEGGESIITDEGMKLLREYERYEEVFEYIVKHPYKKPSITVDGILVENGRILLVKRGREPFKGMYALPGGFVEYGEKTEDAIVREVEEETGLKTKVMELVGVYSDPKRDPRDHTITIVYELQKIEGEIKGGDDASYAGMFSLDDLPLLAFDHSKIVEDFKNKKFNK
jgi:8-oxo-dGTP diphosphatase